MLVGNNVPKVHERLICVHMCCKMLLLVDNMSHVRGKSTFVLRHWQKVRYFVPHRIILACWRFLVRNELIGRLTCVRWAAMKGLPALMRHGALCSADLAHMMPCGPHIPPAGHLWCRAADRGGPVRPSCGPMGGIARIRARKRAD